MRPVGRPAPPPPVRMLHPRLLWLSALALVLPVPALAQGGALSGTVRDARTGAPLPGAVVTRWDGATPVGQATADAEGWYSFLAAPVGTGGPASPARPFAVGPAYPNPGRGGVVAVPYSAPPGYVGTPTLDVFDVTGRRVAPAGGLAAGVYLYRVDFGPPDAGGGGRSDVRRLVLVGDGAADVRLARVEAGGPAEGGLAEPTPPRPEARLSSPTPADTVAVELSAAHGGYAGRVRTVATGVEAVDFQLSPLEGAAVAFGGDVSEGARAHVASVYTPYGSGEAGARGAVVPVPYGAAGTLVVAADAGGLPLLVGTSAAGDLSVAGTAGTLVDRLLSPALVWPGSAEAARAAARAHPEYPALVGAIRRSAEAGRPFTDDDDALRLLGAVVLEGVEAAQGGAEGAAARVAEYQRSMQAVPLTVGDGGEGGFLLSNGRDALSGFVEFAVGHVGDDGRLTVTGYLDGRVLDVIAAPPSLGLPESILVPGPDDGARTLWAGQTPRSALDNTVLMGASAVGLVLDAVFEVDVEPRALAYALKLANDANVNAATGTSARAVVNAALDNLAGNGDVVAGLMARAGAPAVAGALAKWAAGTKWLALGLGVVEKALPLRDYTRYVVRGPDGAYPSDTLRVCRFESTTVPCTERVGLRPVAVEDGRRTLLEVEVVADDGSSVGRDATGRDRLVWTSSDPSVADVVADGPTVYAEGPLRAELRRGRATGATTLTARSVNGGGEFAFRVAVPEFERAVRSKSARAYQATYDPGSGVLRDVRYVTSVAPGEDVRFEVSVELNTEIRYFEVKVESPSGVVETNFTCNWDLAEAPSLFILNPLPGLRGPERSHFLDARRCFFPISEDAETGTWKVWFEAVTVDRADRLVFEAGTFEVGRGIVGRYRSETDDGENRVTWDIEFSRRPDGSYALSGSGTFDDGDYDTFTLSGSASYTHPDIAVHMTLTWSDLNEDPDSGSIYGVVSDDYSAITFPVEDEGEVSTWVFTRVQGGSARRR